MVVTTGLFRRRLSIFAYLGRDLALLGLYRAVSILYQLLHQLLRRAAALALLVPSGWSRSAVDSPGHDAEERKRFSEMIMLHPTDAVAHFASAELVERG